jgi:hypothetical protein
LGQNNYGVCFERRNGVSIDFVAAARYSVVKSNSPDYLEDSLNINR